MWLGSHRDGCCGRSTQRLQFRQPATLYKTLSAAVYGGDANLIAVEVDATGITKREEQLFTVRLPHAGMRENHQRMQSPLKNCGHNVPPTRITISLAPADIKKQDSGFDLPIAMARQSGGIGGDSRPRGTGTRGAVRPVCGGGCTNLQ